MASGSFVTYCRVSTDRQGKSGLGLEAQRAAVETFLNGGDWRIAGDFVEIESGANCERPQLAEAIRACRVYGAKLLIAKLDRLSRDAHFLLGLEKAGVDFVAADMPTANRLTVGILAMVAEEERRMISARTKAALEQAKARGVKLGGFRATLRDGIPRDRAVAPSAAEASLRVRHSPCGGPWRRSRPDSGGTKGRGLDESPRPRQGPYGTGHSNREGRCGVVTGPGQPVASND